MDGNSRWGELSAYYLYDHYKTTNPYAGGSFPGFSGQSVGSTQLVVLGDTTTFGSSAVNQFTFSYMRDGNYIGEAVGGVGPSLASLGFAAPTDAGIYPDVPALQGVPTISLNNYSFGINGFPLEPTENTFALQDGFSKIIRTHSLKFGVDYHYDQSNIFSPFAWSNGQFGIYGGATGYDFADLLLGAPASYTQGVAARLNMRNFYLGPYAQDSWRVTSNLTVNYGVRWEIIPSMYDTRNRSFTYVLGDQSTTFPTAPLGLVWPGDPGVPKHIAPTILRNFTQRFGLAYTPNPSGGVLHRLFGDSGKSSIRAGYGMYYTAIEGAGIIGLAEAPYGIFFTTPASPLMAQPFINRATGLNIVQRFPLPVPPSNVSPSNPDANVNWAQFEPISGASVVDTNAVNPYTEAFDLSIERQLGASTLLTLSYVGTRGHHLMSDLDMNPGVPSACLAVSQSSEVQPGTATCGPYGENGVYYPISGGVVNGTRAPFGNEFGGNGYLKSIGNSKYNALEASLHHKSKRQEFLASYTYSKSLDDSSEYGEQINPYDPNLSEGLSGFDMTNNFVFSYTYELPFDKLFRADNRWTRGWEVSGITRFTTGLPVTISENDDNSLQGSCNTGPNGACTDEPNFTPGKLLHNTNPRSGETYFNTALFSPELIGQQGLARRRFFHGPGINNFDTAMLRNLKLTESKSLEFRAEFFNVFNHAQFYGASAVNGNINSSAFGTVLSAAAPRIGQLAMKVVF